MSDGSFGRVALRKLAQMGLFDWISRRHDSDAEEPLPEFPWDRRPSLYDHVRDHLRPDGAGLTEAGQTLPDEERIAAGSPIRWAAGAMDGVATHHMGGSDSDAAAELLRRVLAYSRSPTAVNKLSVYEFVVEQGVVSLVDPFLTSLAEQERLDHARLYDLARSLATVSPDREPTKFGLALLGLFGRDEDREIFRTLGRHDEFTLYCAVALGNTEEAEQELYDLARSVEGWGRVHCVERLARIAERPDVKDWLLRDGYKNAVMYEYLAAACAVGGGLLEALSRDAIDRGLLDAAGEILRAMIAGGPAEGLTEVEDGPALVTHYLRQAEARASTVGDLRTVLAIRDFVEDEEDREAREVQGWSEAVREELRLRCRAIQGRPEWRACVEAGLRSEDEQTFYDASRVAHAVGVEAWPDNWARLQALPLDSGRWFHAVHGCDAGQMGEIVALAERTLPLESIATGPGQETGLGPGFEAHHCLDYILQDLGRFPGQGSRLLDVGLRSPVVRNRNMALKTLSEWEQHRWPAGMTERLEQARDAEPDPEVRRRIENLIGGRPLDDGAEQSDP